MKTKEEAAAESWWAGLSNGEKHVIWCVMRMLRGAKRSELSDVAQAAKKWERGIACFIKWRLKNGAGRARRA